MLGLLAQGLPNKGIAHQLGISPKTVGNHVEHIYTKLGVSNRAGAAMQAMQHGLVERTPARRGSRSGDRDGGDPDLGDPRRGQALHVERGLRQVQHPCP